MRGASKKLVAVFAALLLAAVLAACGGGDSSTSTASEAGGTGQSEGKPSDAASKQAGESGSEKQAGGSAGGEGSAGSGSSSFVPSHHQDSGGGSEQFRVKGGDNSVQEFGSEADASELEAAAAVLHDFLDARAAGDWAAVCRYMSKAAIKSLEELATQEKGKSCGEVLQTVTNPAAQQSLKAEAAQADVGSLRIEGERAFIIYAAIDGTIVAMPMENEAGTWKVGSLAGTPLS